MCLQITSEPASTQLSAILRDLVALRHTASISVGTDPDPRNQDSPDFIGLIRTAEDRVYWVGLWPRTVNSEQAFEIRLSPKKERRS